MSDTEFIVIEGLDGVGKSTAAAVVRDRLHAVNPLDEIKPYLAASSRLVDTCESPAARFFFWLGINSVVSERAQSAVAEGRHVVVDSYVFRTIACHACLGIKEVTAIDLRRFFEPTIAVVLNLSEELRVDRVRRRDGALDRHQWDYLLRSERQNVLGGLRSLGMTEIDVDSLTVDGVADAILECPRFTWPGRSFILPDQGKPPPAASS